MTAQNEPKLYWVSTPDGAEDWFILARTPEQACSFHVEQEGYGEGDATAELVCELSRNLEIRNLPSYPSQAVIEGCGGKFIGVGHSGSPSDRAINEMLGSSGRAVAFGDKIYSEGEMLTAAKMALEPERLQ